MINDNLDSNTKFEELKNKKNAIKYFFLTDLMHKNDDNDKLPITKLISMCTP